MNREPEHLDEDEAILKYRQLLAGEKLQPKALPAQVFPGQASEVAPLVALGAAAVDDDPWGAEDGDEYAVAGLTTDGDDERAERRRKASGGLAFRGSGTRGGGKPTNSPAAGPMGATAAPGTTAVPGATVGGVGAPTGMGGSPGLTSLQQLQAGSAQTTASGSMPVSLLQSAQSAGRGGGSGAPAFAPAGGGGLQAASAGPGIYDPEMVKEALRLNGFGTEEEDADEAQRTQGSDSSRGPNQRRPESDLRVSPPPPISSVPSTPTTAPKTPTLTPPPKLEWPVVRDPVPPRPKPVSNPPTVAPPTVTPPPTTTPQPPSVQNPVVPIDRPTPQPPVSGPKAAGTGDDPGTRFSQETPQYTSPIRTGGYAVTSDDLRRDAKKWAEASDLAQPIVDAILKSPSPTVMFGHMSVAVPAYQEAFDTSKECVQQAGDDHEVIAQQLETTAYNFEDQEAFASALGRGLAE